MPYHRKIFHSFLLVYRDEKNDWVLAHFTDISQEAYVCEDMYTFIPVC